MKFYHILILLLIFNYSFAQESADITSFPVSKTANSKLRVVLDPGHGGRDSVTRGGTLLEKNLVLDISNETKRVLELAGYEVLMTRTKDEYISLSERTYVQGDVFISLHANMVADSIGPSVRSMIKGIEIYTSVAMKNPKLVNESSLLAKSFETNLKSMSGINIRGVKKKNLAVLDNNSSAALLIELGFLSNEEDLAFLSDKSNYAKIATAIKNSIEHYQEQLNR